MTDKVEIKLKDTSFEAPVVVGTENERAIDIANLRAKTGLVTLDPAFMNTASTKSAITFLDGEKGILRYRGYPIEQLAEKSHVRRDGLPPHLRRAADARPSSIAFSTNLTRHSLIHEDMKHFFDGFPSTAHPMAVLSVDGVLALDVLPGRARHQRQGEDRHHDRAPHLEGADDRGLRVQEARSASRSSTRRTTSSTRRTSCT